MRHDAWKYHNSGTVEFSSPPSPSTPADYVPRRPPIRIRTFGSAVAVRPLSCLEMIASVTGSIPKNVIGTRNNTVVDRWDRKAPVRCPLRPNNAPSLLRTP